MIRDEGISYIADAICVSNVISLNVSTNALSNKGLERVLKAVIPNETIIELDISSNQENGKNVN